MQRKIFSIWIFIFVFHFCNLEILAYNYQVCPVDTTTKEKFVHIYDNLLFSGFEIPSFICQYFEDKRIKDVVLLYQKNFKPFQNLTNSLSTCGVRMFFFDLSVDETDDLSGKIPCVKSEKVFVMSLTTFGLKIANTFNGSNCTEYSDLYLHPIVDDMLDVCERLTVLEFNPSMAHAIIYQLKYNNVEKTNYKHLRIVTVGVAGSCPPFIVTSKTDNDTNQLSGIVFEILRKLASELNFNFTIEESPDNAFGRYINGSWNGMVGMLERKEVDMAVAPMTVTFPRSQVVDFSSQFYFEQVGIMVKIQSTQSFSAWNFLLLFDGFGWVAIVLSCIVATCCIYVVNNFAPVDSTKSVETMDSCVWYVYAVMVNQFAVTPLQDWSSKIFITIWRLCTFILLSIYISGLVASLSTAQMLLPFEDLQGLVNAVEKGSYKNDKSETMTILRNWLLDNPSFVNDNCLELFSTTDNVAILEEVTNLKFYQYKLCNNSTMIILNDRFFPGYFGFALQKHSPFTKMVSEKITKMVETGLIEVWRTTYNPKPSFCEIFESTSTHLAANQPLSIFELTGAFYAVAFGLCLSWVVFFAEYLGQKFCFRNNTVYVNSDQ